MKKTDLAYTAGIIDGEGCIGIQKTTYANAIYVAVVNTNEWLIRWLRFCYGGNIRIEKSRGPNNKPQFRWAIHTKQAGEFLKLVSPYLRLKRPQAELALSFQSRRKHRGGPGIKGAVRMSDEERILDEANKILMHSYNRKGITPS